MEVTKMKLKDLIKPEKNVRIHTEQQMKEFQRSVKKKLMIADNKIFSLGFENLETFNSFLEELQGDLDIPGFDEEILKQIVSEADDITNKISEYGILDEEEIQSMRKNAERKEEQIQRIESEQQPNQALLPIQPTSESIVDNEDEDFNKTKKFAICPNCGEKIWL